MGIEIEEKINNIVNWTRKQVIEARKKGVIFGLSGGIDSAVIAVICKKAFPNTTTALILPCESNPLDVKDAMKVIKKYGIDYKNIDLTPIYQYFFSIMGSNEHKLANANIKPRLRMITLYYFANILEYLVVGTGNKSELQIGYFTKYGDGGVDILPLGNILKSEVREIAKFLNIPQSIIDKVPSAGLWENQTDEDEMGFTYAQLDQFLSTGKIEDDTLKNYIKNLNQKTAHKRKIPSIPDFNHQ